MHHVHFAILDRNLLLSISDVAMQSQREQSIRQKLGSILGLGQSRSIQSPQRNLEDHVSKSEHSTFITDDVLRVSRDGLGCSSDVMHNTPLFAGVGSKCADSAACEGDARAS